MSKAFALFVVVYVFLVAPCGAEPPLAEKPDYYYGEQVQIERGDLKDQLQKVLQSFHIAKPGQYDIIVDTCSADHNDECYTHKKLSYRNAREYMFGFLYLKDLSQDKFGLPTVYCETQLTSDQFPDGQNLGHMKIPYHQIVNAEHAWPQSHFTGKFSKSLQKSDLHSLYPVRMKVNSTRGNHPFGEVVEVKSEPCDKAFLGSNSKGHTVFEPADSIKGNLARSLFYFSIRYQTPIDSDQEKVLRDWHNADPVDEEEYLKHEDTFHIQYVRNPFIDHPEWVNQIQNF